MRIVCVDTEHASHVFKPWNEGFYLTCVGVVTEEDGERHEDIVWFDHRDVEATVDGLKIVQSVVDGADLLVMHNAKHDINVLRGFGITFNDTKLHCTMVADYLIEGQDKELGWKLNDLAKRYGSGGKHDEVAEYWDRGEDTYDIPSYLLGPYCLQDCNLTLDIYHKQLPRIKSAELERVVGLQNEFTYVLSDMETTGLTLDTAVADNIIKTHQAEADKYAALILENAGIEHVNLGSPQQLSALLYGGIMKTTHMEWQIQTLKSKPYSYYKERKIRTVTDFKGLGFKPKKKDLKDDGYYKVDKDTIETLPAPSKRHRELKLLLVKYSENAKVVSTLQGKKGDKGLLSKIQPDGRIHPSFNQCIAATGRLTSSDPNGQNLPRGNTSPIKTCFIPRMDGVLQVDLSQVEWRGAAWLSQDEKMLHEVNSGIDQHVATVKELMEMEFISKADKKSKENRDHAKVFNFRMIYGGSEWGFFLDIKMPDFSLKKWRVVIANFFNKYCGLLKFHQESIKFVFRHGYLRIPTGRWFKFHKQQLKNGEYDYKINQIKNFPVQGISGGDILPLMAVIIRRGMRKMKLKSKMILTVHDSLVFDYLAEERDKLAKLCFEVGNNLDKYIKAYYKLDWNVKLECEVEVGPNYGSLKEIKYDEIR